LLDTIKFWFGDCGEGFEVVSANCFENRAPDHVVIASRTAQPRLELEMTLLSWRNHFTCDVFAEKGTAHIRSLCKWGPTTFTHRTRVLPSGRPPEQQVTFVQDDPTWELEYAYFKQQCASGAHSDLSNDLWLNRLLRELGVAAVKEAA
jgi:scyllo-inositol 2-dehydrogenase (NADP+)